MLVSIVAGLGIVVAIGLVVPTFEYGNSILNAHRHLKAETLNRIDTLNSQHENVKDQRKEIFHCHH
jgi:hypothetical protein